MDGFDLTGVDVPDFGDDDLLMPHEREQRDVLRAMVAELQRQNELLTLIAKRLGPKLLVRDEQRRIVGVRPIEE